MFIFVYFFTQTDPTRTVQRSALCRSRRELSNEYLLAKIGVDTAENEPLEIWGKIQFIVHSPPYLQVVVAVEEREEQVDARRRVVNDVPGLILTSL